MIMKYTIPTYEIIDSLENSVSMINIYRKQGKLATVSTELTTLLENLDELISRSLIIYFSLESDINDNGNDDDNRVYPSDISKANKLVGNILLKIISGELILNDDKDDDRMEQAAKIIAHLSGRGAPGSHVRSWIIPFSDPNGNIQHFNFKLHEPGYTENNIGLKTWGAAPLLAKKLIQQNLIPDIKTRPVLELGTGTGLTGIICEKLGAPEVILTDYHDNVLENAKVNVQLNECSSSICQLKKLDFIEFAKSSINSEWKDKKFSIVIASDLLYEMDHAEYLPIAVEKLMENDFYFLIPLRDTHWNEVNRFEEKMIQVGLHQRIKEDTVIQEDEGVVKYRYYEYSRFI